MKKAERNIVCTTCGQQVGEGYQSHKCPDTESKFMQIEMLPIYTKEELDTYLKQSLEELKKEIEAKSLEVKYNPDLWSYGKGLDDVVNLIDSKLKELK